MSDVTDPLQAEERQAFERENELVEQEQEVQQQEQGLIDMERSYAKRVKALVSLVSYVGEQERSLLARAETIGPAARELVEETIDDVDETAVLDELDFGMEEMRQTMLERRLDLVDVRTALLEDRESLYHERADKLENAETRIAEFEESLLAREMEIAAVLRKLITGAAELAADVDFGTADTVAELPTATRSVRETNSIGRESLKVESGTARARKAKLVPAPEDEPEAVVADEPDATDEPDAPDEDEERAEAETVEEELTDEDDAETTTDTAGDQGNVRFNLEANLNGEAGHTFFSYDDDGDDDLPGLFIATHNLLKEDREVRVALEIDDVSIQLQGIVAWRRVEADDEGPVGMGIEITWIGPGGPEAVGGWLAEHNPIIV